MERLESRSMLAADIVEAAIDPVPDEMVPDETVGTDSMDPIAVDEWQACEPFVCDLQPYDFVDPTPVVDPVIIDDSCLMGDDASLMVCEPVDIRVMTQLIDAVLELDVPFEDRDSGLERRDPCQRVSFPWRWMPSLNTNLEAQTSARSS
jgi:hypothetical protein